MSKYVIRHIATSTFVIDDTAVSTSPDLQDALVVSKTTAYFIIEHKYRSLYELCPVSVNIQIEGNPIAV